VHPRGSNDSDLFKRNVGVVRPFCRTHRFLGAQSPPLSAMWRSGRRATGSGSHSNQGDDYVQASARQQGTEETEKGAIGG
jgi:hypothetical protein